MRYWREDNNEEEEVERNQNLTELKGQPACMCLKTPARIKDKLKSMRTRAEPAEAAPAATAAAVRTARAPSSGSDGGAGGRRVSISSTLVGANTDADVVYWRASSDGWISKGWLA